MLRRLHQIQPASFAFTPANEAWATAQVTKYPEGRQASAVIPLLWRAQEQEGWLSRPAIEHVADRLGMPYIRALEVATFYFMFQLAPVGSVAHVQVCGTLSCMLRGSEDLMELCKSRISPHPHHPSADGRLSWEEVECLGACANAPMAQIGKDYYEDLDVESLGRILDEIDAGGVPRPGSASGRFASEPSGGVTSLHPAEGAAVEAANASVALAVRYGDTLKRIDGTEQPWSTPWLDQPEAAADTGDGLDAHGDRTEPTPGEGLAVSPDGLTVQEAPSDSAARPEGPSNPDDNHAATGAPVVATAPVGEPIRHVRPVAPDAASDPDAVASASPLGDTSGLSPASAPQAVSGDTAPGQAGLAAAASVRRAPGRRDDPRTRLAVVEAAELDRRVAELQAIEPVEPPRLSGPRGGVGDDLERIGGVGPKINGILHGLGVWHFDQIAAWGPAEVAWVDRHLTGFHGRIVRERWVEQAGLLMAERG